MVKRKRYHQFRFMIYPHAARVNRFKEGNKIHETPYTMRPCASYNQFAANPSRLEEPRARLPSDDKALDVGILQGEQVDSLPTYRGL